MKKLPIVIDTREQLPLDFSPFADVRVVRTKLWPGDYSIIGGSKLVAIERKSVSDLIGTMKTGYAGYAATSPKRFDAELLALGGIARLGGRAFVLVEPDLGYFGLAEEQIKEGAYRADIPPSKVLAFIERMKLDWKIPVIFATSRTHAAEIVVSACRAADAVKKAWRSLEREISSEPPRTGHDCAGADGGVDLPPRAAEAS